MVSTARVTLLLAAIPLAAGAQPAPYNGWRTLDTPHFHVHAPAGLEREGRVAGAAAERAYALLARELVPPRGRIDLIVSDDADYSNGSATPFPVNRIVVFAAPPVESEGLRLNEDWLGLVITHELTHIFHLDRVRGPWAAAQRVFGRSPVLFPNAYSPSWLIEGLAVYYESRLTAGGRLHDAEHLTIARAAAFDDRLPHLGDLSLATPRFPGGSVTYAYGSLFMDWLARQRGDSAVPRFVERQSGAWIPALQDRAARRAFGITFGGAFDAWRDSVLRDVRPARPALTGWRPLTTHGYYALNPRWVNDTTLAYTGTDGRETGGTYTVTVTGVRQRVGRRAGSGASVPLPGGGFLYAQPEYAGTDEVRSDLYLLRDGHERRLTRGARLVQPDVRGDGRIVAVELAAARASLVLLDSAGGNRRVLREAGPDETWSEPRWSPDGLLLAVVHRAHGGAQRIDVIDAHTGAACTAVRDSTLLASPSWPTANAIVYTSERTGLPQVEVVARCGGGRLQMTHAAAGVAGAEAHVRHELVATWLRADGYHIGLPRILFAATAPPNAPTLLPPAPDSTAPQPLAAGEYRNYAILPSLAPRYWLPVLESGPAGATRLGAFTSAHDPVYRHAYDASLALQTNGRLATGSLSYRYAGLRRPYLDVALSQDWTARGGIGDSAGARLGTVLRRTQDLSLAATLARPRVRTFASLSAGLALERRRFATDPAPLLARLDSAFHRDYSYPRVFASASFSNTQRPRLAISREDGVAVGFTARERLRLDDAPRTASSSVVGTAAGYRALALPGYAHHVVALRVAGGLADARAPVAFEVGGTSGRTLDVAPGLTVGEGRRTFGVRGFPVASLYGTRAASASLEYRAPLALGGRGTWTFPAFFDRSSVSAFADAGTASCPATPLYPGTCAPMAVLGRVIASVGAEAGVSVALFQVDAPELLRVGMAVPAAGRAPVNAFVDRVPAVSVYLALGSSF